MSSKSPISSHATATAHSADSDHQDHAYDIAAGDHDGWTTCVDESSGASYYWNTITNQVTWSNPYAQSNDLETDSTTTSASASSSTARALPGSAPTALHSSSHHSAPTDADDLSTIHPSRRAFFTGGSPEPASSSLHHPSVTSAAATTNYNATAASHLDLLLHSIDRAKAGDTQPLLDTVSSDKSLSSAMTSASSIRPTAIMGGSSASGVGAASLTLADYGSGFDHEGGLVSSSGTSAKSINNLYFDEQAYQDQRNLDKAMEAVCQSLKTCKFLVKYKARAMHSSHAHQPPFTLAGTDASAHTGPINVARYDALGNYVLTGGADKTLRLWNASDRRVVVRFLGHGWDILDAAFAPDGSVIASCGGDKGVFIWDVASATLTRKFTGHTQRINAVAFNTSAAVVASGSYDATVKLWDMKSHSKAPIQVLSEAKDSVTCVTIRDHEILAGSVDGCVRRYDVRTGTLVTDTLGSPVTCASYSADSQCVLVSSLGAPVRLLDADSGELLNSFVGHVAESYRMAAALDFRDMYVLSGSEKDGACVWDLVGAEGQAPVQRLVGEHRGPVLAVATSPKRVECVTGGADGKVGWWVEEKRDEEG